jgi:hypothetical protein
MHGTVAFASLLPSAIVTHCPTALHAKHAVVHALSQHTPSTQWPDAHS